MDYDKFKEEVLEELRKQRDDGGIDIVTTVVKKNNGADYEGVEFKTRITGSITAAPVFRLQPLYEAYNRGEMDIAACARTLWEDYEQNKNPEGLCQFVEGIRSWDLVKGRIYPFLLPMEGNMGLLENLVAIPMYDLAVVFIIRGEMPSAGNIAVKFTNAMLEDYKVSRMEVYNAAMANMGNDGYSFIEMDDVIGECLKQEGMEWMAEMEGMKLDMPGRKKMYVLTNASKLYGAAGILNRKLVREFADGRDMYILPSSIHEMIFVLASDKYNIEELDQIVADINELQVAKEERLTDHCYFYDAKADEIRMEP